MRQQIQAHSSDTLTYNNYPNNEDLFFSVNGLGNGIWGLRNHIIIDNNVINGNKNPGRKLTTINRIIRDTALSNDIKRLVNYCCQLCDITIKLPNNSYYIEAHHIKPLGSPYNGPDTRDNILIVCPNCHIKCDYKLIQLSLSIISNNIQKVNEEYINFYNNEYKVVID
ncbi:HNH endonuclease [Flavobacterium sp. H4147]|uniref:HNH endonuclease n=1 Tax=Flavobacterium sp. H4147 TaxID=3034149 RepID=UPI0035A38E8D